MKTFEAEQILQEAAGGAPPRVGDLLIRGEKGWRFVRFEDAYTLTNASTDRALDPTTATLQEVGNVLATLIADLQSAGVLK